MRVGATLFVAAIVVSSCTQILGIDGRYVGDQGVAESGGVPSAGGGGAFDADLGSGGELASGGTGGSTGGRTGGGGIIAAGGTGSAGGSGGTIVTGGAPAQTGGLQNSGGLAVDGNAPCGAGEKRCPTVGCVIPDPSVGCDLATPCAPCDTSQNPASSYSICSNSQCDYECSTGYTRNQTTGNCDAATSGSGGSSGAGGAGGSGGGPLGSRCIKQTPLSGSTECRNCGVFPGCCNGFNRCGCLYVAACI